ncbi:MAG: metalloregulator ArsR/SmtB family transcription factor [Bacteroidia bacterium]|nr:metalloregulator ArsR/SmtB family transcription factor [Bacteroidia bacterium]
MGLSKSSYFTEKQNRIATITKAIGHPARVAILEHLINANSCICGDLVNVLPLSQPTVSQHLKELRNAGIIKGEIEGNSICYCINPEILNELTGFIQIITQNIFSKSIKNHQTMNLTAFKKSLKTTDSLTFFLANGSPVPAHFHITEAGLVTKHFIDCGGTVRQEKRISMQIWVAEDTDHRLTPKKLLNIIEMAEKLFGNEDLPVEMEYQAETIGKYDVAFSENRFVLHPKYTDCLAKEQCGIPEEKSKVSLTGLIVNNNAQGCCTPNSGCC